MCALSSTQCGKENVQRVRVNKCFVVVFAAAGAVPIKYVLQLRLEIAGILHFAFSRFVYMHCSSTYSICKLAILVRVQLGMSGGMDEFKTIYRKWVSEFILLWTNFKLQLELVFLAMCKSVLRWYCSHSAPQLPRARLQFNDMMNILTKQCIRQIACSFKTVQFFNQCDPINETQNQL